MDRVALVAVVMLGMGLLLHPVLTAGGTISPEGSPTTAPSTQPTLLQFSEVKGKDGFWRIGKTSDGVWWFVSPEGSAEFLNTVTTVQPYQEARDPNGPHFLSKDFNGTLTGGGDTRAWAEKTLARVRAAGFKSLGAWSHPVFHELDIAMTRDLNVWAWVAGPCRRLYSTTWYETADKAVRLQAEKLRDNRNLVGYFIDNELDWGDAASGPGFYFNYLPADDANRAVVLKIIKQLWPTIEQFNTDWNVKLASFDELAAMPTLPSDTMRAYDRLYRAFLSQLALDYFKMTTELIRKHDPNHLILGVRFKGYAPPEVVAASAGLTDAQSINYYVSDARLDESMFRMMHESSGGQPVLITEYSFHSLDGTTGNKNVVGFNGQVLDQQARADGYRLFTKRLASVPYIIGADWFQWNDEPASGRQMDGEDVNFGVVDVHDQPYDLLTQAVRETTPLLNHLHIKSPQTDSATVYRDTFANKPVFHVPHLDKPIDLNADLADWSMATKLPGIRLTENVGSERLPVNMPNVYLGWRDEGLYVAFEIFDNDIDPTKPDGSWWTRDHAEFWVSTRPVASNQTWYDEFAHQFFIVPTKDAPAEQSQAVVGQWHRHGDALSASLIPHPEIKQSAKVSDGKYIVEMFIPTKALNGFDPKNQPAIAFNLYAKNWQHATDYFWSAPKELWTQTRPNTWGLLYLDQPATTQLVPTPTVDVALAR